MSMPPVHWTQANFQAVVENDGHGDDCGVIVIQDYLHVSRGAEMPLTQAQTSAMRQELITAGLFTPGGGMTLDQVAAGMQHFGGPAPVKFVGWGTVDTNQLHIDLRAIATQRWAICVETHDAAALPGNQAGVQNHFVLPWGIDSNLGYYTANGDVQAALDAGASVIDPTWYSWASILASLGGQGAYLIWPEVQAVGVPQGWTDANNVLMAPAAPDGKQYPVVRGFRDYILSHAWDAANIPLENERPYNPLVDSNPAGWGSGIGQQCKASRLVYVEQIAAGEPVTVGTIANITTGMGDDILVLRQQLAACEARPTVDVAGIAADVSTAQASLTDAQKKLGA